MKSIFHAILVASLAIPPHAVAEPRMPSENLHPQLRRASLILTAKLPKFEEYKRLESGGYPELQNITSEYSESEAVRDRLLQHMIQLFRVTYGESGALGSLFERIVSQNVSWDELLLARDLGITRESLGENWIKYSDLIDFSNTGKTPQFEAKDNNLVKDLNKILSKNGYLYSPEKSEDKESLKLKNDSALTGVLATPEFCQRYADTAVNRGRRRAAALFRIFLCDSMAPAVPINAQDEKAQLNLVLGRTAPGKASTDPKVTQEDQHGTNPQCKACHVKLDPAGELTRLQTGQKLSNLPKAGGLVLRRADGTLLQTPVKNVAEFGEKMVTLPEYKSCQVRHFWNWYIGEDVSLSADVEADLVKKFDEVGHKPISFIQVLTKRPEFFRQPYTGNLVSFGKVRPLLKNCTSCHENNPMAPQKRFDSLPIGGDADMNFKMLEKIAFRLDAEHAGLNNTMPPPASQWQPTSAEKHLILSWLKDGAPDDNGNPTLNPNQVRELKVSDNVTRPSTEASFGFGFHRIFDSYTLGEIWNQLFGRGYGDEERMQRIGGMNLVTGRPIQPRLSTVDLEILGQYMLNAQKFSSNYFPSLEIGSLTKAAISQTEPFAKLTKAQQEIVARAVVYKMIGPRIIPNEDTIVQTLLQSIDKKEKLESTAEIVIKMMSTLASGAKDFLTI